jgi:hypothetical protein
MQNTSLTFQLQQAYALIQAGQRVAALRILTPICRSNPNNASAWWLAAHALENQNDIRHALQQVVRINPYYPNAANKLATIESAISRAQSAVIPITQSSATYRMSGGYQQYTPLAQPLPAKNTPVSQRLLFFIVFATVVLIGMSLAIGSLLYNRLDKLASESSDVLADISGTLEANNVEISGTLPTFSNANEPPPPTVDPAVFGETYWNGSDDSVTMERFTVNGRYRRFYDFPVKLYVSGANNDRWQQAVANSVSEINRVVSIQLTNNRNEADIVLEIMSPRRVQAQCVGFSSLTRVVGCGTIEYQGGIVEPVIEGHAIVSTDTNNPTGTVLHELLHAMGVVVHSPYRTDIMYFEETTDIITKMTYRDINTLRRLYEGVPSYAD